MAREISRPAAEVEGARRRAARAETLGGALQSGAQSPLLDIVEYLVMDLLVG
jgi:hypothetical protein